MVVVLTAALGIVFTAVIATGGTPVVTMDAVWFILQCAPIMITLVCWESRLGRSASGDRRMVYGVAGLVAVAASGWPMLWPPVAVASIAIATPRVDRAALARIGRALAAAVIGYATVWSANVLVARAAAHRLADGWLRSSDLLVYNALGVGDGSYSALFPLISAPWGIEALNQSYLLVMPELFVALVLTAWRDGQACERLLRLVFGSYAVGLLCFLALPAVGPCIAFPDSLRVAALPAETQIVMRGMADGFRSVTAGVAEPVIAYFVAVPSLHVLIALILQRALRPFPFSAAFFRPINVLIVLSTFVLGYHYLADVIAAFALYPLLLALLARRPTLATSTLSPARSGLHSSAAAALPIPGSAGDPDVVARWPGLR